MLEGVVLRRGDEVVWREDAEPFAAQLQPAADDYATHCVDLLRGFTTKPVDAQWLDDYSQHGVVGAVNVGCEGRGDAWTFWNEAGTFYDDDHSLLRAAALAVEDPVREVVEAVARRLARQDWTGICP